jgi:hypothetical protein
MDAATVGLIGVVVGAGISTGVTYLLAVRKEATDTRNWRRDHALEAYSEFIRLVNAIIAEAGNAYITEYGTVESVKHRDKLLEKLTELYRTSDRVILLASDELQAPLSALVKHIAGAFVTKSIQSPKASDAEVKAEGARLTEIMADFTFKARNDLGVHPLPEKWWQFWR